MVEEGKTLKEVLDKIGQKVKFEGEMRGNLANVANEASSFLSSQEQEKRVLLYGKVQSGKTNATLATIASCIDKGLRLFVLLTSDNISLYDQTLKRARDTMTNLKVVSHKEIEQSVSITEVDRAIRHGGIIIVCTKNSRNLEKLNDFLDGSSEKSIQATIFDDEADFGSLNSKINSRTASEESRIFSEVNRLLGIFQERAHVMVTATPEAIFLQGYYSARKPYKVFQIPSGKSYTGGESYFDLDNASIRYRAKIIPDNEVQAFLEAVREGARETPEIKSLRDAILDFIVGGAIKSQISKEVEHLSMVVHISSRVSVNDALVEQVKRIVEEIDEKTYNGDRDFEDELHEVYQNFVPNITSQMPDLDKVMGLVKDHIGAANIEKVTTGRGRDDPHYDRLYNIIVGGDRIGRGLTMENLITFYYARSSGAPKVDTMLQHARVYGYRENILDVTRLYLTNELYEIYDDVFKTEKEEWIFYQESREPENQVVPLSVSHGSPLRPTRREVVPIQSLIKYFPGKTYFMKGATDKNTRKIDDLLKDFDENGKEPKEASYDLVKNVLSLCTTEDFNQRWDTLAILNAIGKYVDDGKKLYVIKRTERDLKHDYRAVLEGSQDDTTRRDDGVIVFYYRVKGDKEGWNGQKAWIPVVRFPDRGYGIYFTSVSAFSEESESTE
ncbi:MAG: Z1 domain-containing protein [Candidatus Thermoplasmatota archaeon]|nr:Z1 domain-containing protein [Candidatus Thermoplasmatota archaeon]